MFSRSFEKVASGLTTLWLYLFFIDTVLGVDFVNWILITEVPYSSCLKGFLKFSLFIWLTLFFTAKKIKWLFILLLSQNVQSSSLSFQYFLNDLTSSSGSHLSKVYPPFFISSKGLFVKLSSETICLSLLIKLII